MVQAIFGIMGSESLLRLGVMSVRLSEGSLVLIAACCILHVVSCSCEYCSSVPSYLVSSGP